MSQPHEFDGCVFWAKHPDAIVVISEPQHGANGTEPIVWDANPAAVTMFGYDRTTMLGSPPQRFSLPTSRLRHHAQAWAFHATRSDGSDFVATARTAPLGPPDDLTMVVIRDETELGAWPDDGPSTAGERLRRLQEREHRLEASRETLAQHLFAAGLAIQRLEGRTDPESHTRLQEAVAVLDEILNTLVTT